MYVKVDMLMELARLARGLHTVLPVAVILQWAAQWARVGLGTTETEKLERLYRLEDPRR